MHVTVEYDRCIHNDSGEERQQTDCRQLAQVRPVRWSTQPRPLVPAIAIADTAMILFSLWYLGIRFTGEFVSGFTPGVAG